MNSDDKRGEVICTKVTERIALDLLRAATADDRSISEYLYLLIRHDLYGRHGRPCDGQSQSTTHDKVDRR